MNFATIGLAMCIAVSGSAIAQQKRPPRWLKEPSSVFGLRFDQPFSATDFRDCDTRRDEPPTKINFCRTDSVGYGSPYSIGRFPIAVFHEGILSFEDRIPTGLLITGDHDDYPEIRRILVERYGAPTSRSIGRVQSKAGAVFDSERLEWIGKNLTLTLDERSGEIERTMITFQTKAGAARAAQKFDDKTKADADKM